jgi:hypothetical protein
MNMSDNSHLTVEHTKVSLKEITDLPSIERYEKISRSRLKKYQHLIDSTFIIIGFTLGAIEFGIFLNLLRNINSRILTLFQKINTVKLR